jgi:hypothetical protein
MSASSQWPPRPTTIRAAVPTPSLLLVHGEQPGAFVGKHRVEITAKTFVPDNIDPARRPKPKTFVPVKYSQNSALTFEVPPGGTAEANFPLSSTN